MMGMPFMGAERRLLHPSVPAAFFGLATLGQIAFWLLLAVTAGDVVAYAGGIGPALAVVHALTLGVLLSAAAGAALQILPVTTLQTAVPRWLGWTIFAPLAVAVTLLPLGFLGYDPRLIQVGAVAATLSLGLLAAVLVKLLHGAHPETLPDTRAYLSRALIMLGLFVTLAVLLAGDLTGGFLADHAGVALAHVVLAAYGFMGLLALGFSHVLVPMLALAEPPEAGQGRWALLAAVAGLIFAAAGLASGVVELVPIGALFGLIAAGLHVWLMVRVLKTRMRRRFDLAFHFIIASWVLLPASLITGVLAALGVWPERLALAWAVLLLPGWLLTLLVGVLQRILPFLGSMHTMRACAAPAMVGALTWDLPLKIHAAAHALALALLLAGVLAQWTPALIAAGVVGALGAVCFAAFATTVALRTRRHLAVTPRKA